MRISPLLPLGLLWIVGCAPRSPEPVLSAVNPSVLIAELGGAIVLEGAHFLPAGPLDFDRPDASPLRVTASAWLEQGGLRVDLPGVTWRDAQAIDAVVPAGLPTGGWTVHLVTPRGQAFSLVEGLRLDPFITDAGLLLDGGVPDGGGQDAGAQPCDVFTFRDDDGDLFGLPDSGDFLCGPGRAPDAGDCNDIDSLSSPSGVEVCNGLDDDGDGQVDEQGCADAGLRRTFTLEADDNDFRAAHAWNAGQFWVAGNTRLYTRREDGGFRNASQNCPMNLGAVFADPATGDAFVGGGNNGVGRLTTAQYDGGGCVTAQLLPEPVVGMARFASADGGTHVWVVMRDGRRLAPWDGVSAPVVVGSPLVGVELVRADLLASGTFLAVGGLMGPPQRPLVMRVLPDGTTVTEPLPAGLPDGWLRDVWVINEREAVAVGDQGMVLRRVWDRWEAVPPPQPLAFTAVRAFAAGRFYVAGDGGTFHQWTGQWVSKGTAPRAVRDVTGVAEEHLWLVGDDGLILSGAPVP